MNPSSNDKPVQWRESLLTGILEIDEQHQILVNILNDSAPDLDPELSRKALLQITRDLLTYAMHHFEAEEELMKRHGYAAAEPEEAGAHLQQHRRFSEHVVALRNSLRTGTDESKAGVQAFLVDWFTNHILTADRRLGEFIRTHPQRGE
jgi:hemerythrin